jgi:hypothetical protein
MDRRGGPSPSSPRSSISVVALPVMAVSNSSVSVGLSLSQWRLNVQCAYVLFLFLASAVTESLLATAFLVACGPLSTGILDIISR